jgi:hypothetical protein
MDATAGGPKLKFTMDFLRDSASLQRLLTGFEDGTWPIAEWHHTAHLAVCSCYVLDGPDAMDRLRVRIASYNECQGGKNTPESGYHETLTRFWVEVVRDAIDSLPDGLSRLEVAQRIVAAFGHRRDLFREYYVFDVVGSREARAGWIPPARYISTR